ncbi:MAG: hypothetical protein K0Q95_3245 [Bacteroidota bacterium]|jgi:hypothetical protein|nr:hypothetical protein [Bacteroidota bacterium]
MKILLRLIPILIVGLFLDHIIIVDSDSSFILTGMMFGLVSIIFLLLFCWVLYRDQRIYRATSNKLNFIPTIAGLLLILSFFVTSYVLSLRDKSPKLLQAAYDGGYNGAWFEFREDGTYKFCNSSGIGVDYFRGKYSMTDTIITLDKMNIDNVIKSNKLAIRQNLSLASPTKEIYQINDNHAMVDKNFVFTVNFDNRKK